jgi:outer membrane protein assembly factor BamA
MLLAIRSLRRLLTLALVAALASAALAQGPNERVIVSDIIIQGNRLVASEHIRNQLSTQIGKELSPEVLQEDIRNLFGTRQYANVWADKVPDGPGRVKVVIKIRDHDSVVRNVEYKGNAKLSRDDLDLITGVRKGMPCNPYANKVACQKIVSRYREEGKPWASCVLEKGGEPGDTDVIFRISEGPYVRISAINFTGNTFVSSEVLRQRINSGAMVGSRIGLHTNIGGTFNPALVEHDASELLKYYRSFGYHDVRISRELTYAPDGRTVAVTFHISEGVRYKVLGKPQVHGYRSGPTEALEALTTLKANEYYDQRAVESDKLRIRNYVGYTGRETRVADEHTLVPEKPGFVRVSYQVAEEQPARVGQVIIYGNDRTQQNVILRQLPLYPGQILTYPDLKQAESNLARLGIFEMSPDGSVRPTVTVRNDPFNPDSPFKTVEVNVNETSTGSLMFGLGVNSDAGFTGSVVLNERNFDLFRLPTSLEDAISGNAFRGAGQEFRLEAVPGTQVQRYMVSFREPFLFDSPYSLTTSGYFFQRFYNEYSEERLGARVTLGRKIADHWSIAGTVRAENVDVGNVYFFAPPDYLSVVGGNFQVGARVGVTFDDRDSILRPTKGQNAELAYEQVLGDRVFPLVNFDFSKYWTVAQRADGSGKHVIAFHNQIGWAGSNTPVYEKFFGGGFRSIRGFQFRGVGPDVNGYMVGGNFLFLNSLEYQMPIRASDQVFAVAFVDSGTVSPRIDQWESYRVSAGFGIRFTVPMLGPVPIALDFGFPIVKARTDREQVFNFWMGFTR